MNNEYEKHQGKLIYAHLDQISITKDRIMLDDPVT
jgi:hypothetical protein